VNFSFEESKEILKWDPSVSSQDNQIVGYTVIARDQQSKETKTYRTTETNLVTHNWKAGSYWICVQARGKVSESSCSTFWGHTIDREPEEINVSYSMRNPTLLTWRSSERSAPDAKLQSIRIELRMAGKSEILSSVEFAANVREWTLPKLNNGEYEFCVVGINSYGQSECEWESFEIAPKQNQTYSLPVTSLKVGGRVSIWNEFDNIFSLQITSADVCKAEGKVNRVEVTALKAGVCTFEISADETSNYLAFKKRYSLKVTKAISNSSQRITIECVKNEKIKYITGSKPQCPAGYRRR